MPDRLSPLDVSFLYMEEATTPMHVGGVAIFEVPESGFDYERLVRLIRERIALVPRYRQRVRWVPGHLANPVWVDDENFDVTYHVRRSALPRPGTQEQLNELVARIMSRPLDRERPLWEMYLVEGLEGGRFAVLSKTHHAMVDGIAAVDIGQVILDSTPEPRVVPADDWRPRREPSSAELVVGAVNEIARSPKAVVDTVRTGIGDAHETATQIGRNVVGVASALRTMARPARSGPLNAPVGSARRYATTSTDLQNLKRIKHAHGGTINDIVLSILAGALRAWMMTRGEVVTHSSSVRAMVPVSVRTAHDSSGNQIAAFLCDLPIGEPDPVIRLERVRFEMDLLKETGQMLAATALVGVASFTPPTVHSLGARVVSGLSRRVYNTVITNVPGPQFPLFAGGARMLAAYPVVPLARGQSVSIGLTSYDGGVYFGLNADRDSMPDVEVLAQCIDDAVTEMLATVTAGGRPRRPRSRKPVS
ncbi:MAG: wax ester/triacylglycerol synthase family O-acyltransferase [Candidatus Nanopelagicales bacterium]|jgi:WS/DGAT/MGAT family acyltransferase|nr:wax ester/triacylglycerol synthase family O-acyltransferase [Candidatus Nanopelagicales bacterium]